MTHALTIAIPEPIYQALEAWATRQGTTAEDLAQEWVSRRVMELENDALMRWAGSIECDEADVAERHDEYLGQALSRHVRDDPR